MKSNKILNLSRNVQSINPQNKIYDASLSGCDGELVLAYSMFNCCYNYIRPEKFRSCIVRTLLDENSIFPTIVPQKNTDK